MIEHLLEFRSKDTESRWRFYYLCGQIRIWHEESKYYQLGMLQEFSGYGVIDETTGEGGVWCWSGCWKLESENCRHQYLRVYRGCEGRIYKHDFGASRAETGGRSWKDICHGMFISALWSGFKEGNPGSGCLFRKIRLERDSRGVG